MKCNRYGQNQHCQFTSCTRNVLLSMDTRSMSSSPLVNSLVTNRLFKTAPDIDEPPFQFIHTMDLSVVDTMLHDSRDLIINRTEIWAVWTLEATGWMQESLAFLDAAVQLLHGTARCACALSCWNTKSLVVTRRSAYRWQQYDVIMTSRSSIEEVSKRYHQNFLLCNNSEFTECIADLFNSFCEEVYAVAFLKVLQQQTI